MSCANNQLTLIVNHYTVNLTEPISHIFFTKIINFIFFYYSRGRYKFKLEAPRKNNRMFCNKNLSCIVFVFGKFKFEGKLRKSQILT